MINLKELHAQYVTNETGERISVILPISDFQELMEDIQDLAAVAERRKEPMISHEQLVSELKKDALL